MQYPRYIASCLAEAVEDTPAVLVHGPRQSGKTTLVKEFGESNDYTYVTFDSDAQVRAATEDPIGFVARLGPKAVLDEVQRVPHLFTTLKAAIDRDRTPGRFVMTGSANVLMVPALADSLAGRMEILRMSPLSQAEIHGNQSTFIANLLDNSFAPRTAERLGSQLAAIVTTGGYPEALARSPRRAASFLRAHAETQIQRDVKDLARIRALEIAPNLLRQVSAYTAQLANVSRLAGDLGVARETVNEHLVLLENIFVISRLRAWSKSEAKRLARAPKLHISDTGMGAALLRMTAADLDHDRTSLGHLLESFVLAELQAQAAWHDADPTFSHFRDAHQYEVDIVLERGPHRVAGVEVKASATVSRKDFDGLKKLRDAAASSFTSGVVLYDGNVGYRHEENLWALPISMLWEANA